MNTLMGRSHAWVKRGCEFIDRVPMNWGKNPTLYRAIRRSGWVALNTAFESANAVLARRGCATCGSATTTGIASPGTAAGNHCYPIGRVLRRVLVGFGLGRCCGGRAPVRGQ